MPGRSPLRSLTPAMTGLLAKRLAGFEQPRRLVIVGVRRSTTTRSAPVSSQLDLTVDPRRRRSKTTAAPSFQAARSGSHQHDAFVECLATRFEWSCR